MSFEAELSRVYRARVLVRAALPGSGFSARRDDHGAGSLEAPAVLEGLERLADLLPGRLLAGLIDLAEHLIQSA